MVTVSYDYEFPYGHDPNGRQYPRLTLTLAHPGDPEQAVDLDAYLDSGAERSLFNGSFAPVQHSLMERFGMPAIATLTVTDCGGYVPAISRLIY
jgi:hypothetical protein